LNLRASFLLIVMLFAQAQQAMSVSVAKAECSGQTMAACCPAGQCHCGLADTDPKLPEPAAPATTSEPAPKAIATLASLALLPTSAFASLTTPPVRCLPPAPCRASKRSLAVLHCSFLI
jgi:hypothetical protein